MESLFGSASVSRRLHRRRFDYCASLFRRQRASSWWRNSLCHRSYDKAKWSKIYGADRLFPAKASFHNVSGWNRQNLTITGDLDDGQLLLRLQNGEWKLERPE